MCPGAYRVAASIAPFYDKTKAYNAGDVAMFNGIRRKAKSKVEAGEEFDKDKWQDESIQEALANL